MRVTSSAPEVPLARPPAHSPPTPRPSWWKSRHQIFGQFLTLIAGAGSAHTGVKLADFTEERMVPLPMDNYEDLKVGRSYVSFISDFQTCDCQEFNEESGVCCV